MIFGDISLYSMVRRLKFMPLLIIASRICPEGAEATLFALLMSLSNLGDTVAINIGAIILRIFNVTEDNYDNFIYVVIVKSLLRLTLIPFIPLLAPDGSPQTRDEYDTNQDQESQNHEKDIEIETYNAKNHEKYENENDDNESDTKKLNVSSSDSTTTNNLDEDKKKWIQDKKQHDLIFAEEYVSPIAQSAIIT